MQSEAKSNNQFMTERTLQLNKMLNIINIKCFLQKDRNLTDATLSCINFF